MKIEQLVNQAVTSPIYQYLKETPLTKAPKLSKLLGCDLLLKREDQQPIFSFKVRGAYNKMIKLGEERRRAGVVAASAGNHAQGVAHAARALGVSAHICMPVLTPMIKVRAVRDLSATVQLIGKNFEETLKFAKKYAKQKKLEFFHPFDDDDVIVGQATIGVELLRAMPEDAEAIFVACGGGGLLAGISAVVKQLRPGVKVFGVEPEDAASMDLAIKNGKPTKLAYVGTFAETVAIAKAGVKPFKICRDRIDGIYVIDIGSICNCIKEIYEDTRVIVEPSGALGVAGAKEYIKSPKFKGGSLVSIMCGANMNFDALSYVIERSASGDHSEMLLAAKIPEKPGSFMNLCKQLGKHNVLEFNYRYSQGKDAFIFAGISIKEDDKCSDIIAALKKKNIDAVDMTGDETAELHVRHMVGGRTSLTSKEHVYRFEFPEKHGALIHFLKHLAKWNMSLFHYRFHAADVGRVLAGFQLPNSSTAELEATFRKIGYPFWEVSDSLAYKTFLADPDKEA